MRHVRRRSLTRDERALWEAVARTASPLRDTVPVAAPPEPAPRPVELRPEPGPAAAVPPPRRRTAAPELFDRRTVGRIARGSIELDGRLDLHGMTQDEAHRRLFVFLAATQLRGGRIVLVITGKGGAGPDDRGVLRRAVPLWLSSPAFRGVVAGLDQAHRTHGGSGAIYVRVRKAR